KMVESFETASFEMEIGEVRLVETKYGYHLIEKLEKTEEDFSGKVKEDGKTEGGNKSAVISSMSVAKIRAEALELLAKLQSGEATSYPEETNEKGYYLSMEPSLINKNESTYATFIEMVSAIEEGKFAEKDFPGDATYVIRRLSLSAEDITTDIYNTIKDDLAFDAFGEYVQSFYDKITINKEIIEKFDVLTVPSLDSELYTFG
ncbi:MAG: peptidylprolyl isomerase, partial [Clostridia bacterium]|nr:peptidylprolyl isomerase [Clostridia bacterium]